MGLEELLCRYGNKIVINNIEKITSYHFVTFHNINIKARLQNYKEYISRVYDVHDLKYIKLNKLISNSQKELRHPHFKVRKLNTQTGAYTDYFYSITGQGIKVASYPDLFEDILNNKEFFEFTPVSIDMTQNLYLNQYKAIFNIQSGDEDFL